MLEAQPENPAQRKRKEIMTKRLGGIRALAAVVGLALAAAGCGIGEKMSDLCNDERLGHERLSRLASTMSRNGVDPQAANYRGVRERLNQARAQLAACEASAGGVYH